MGAVVLLDPDDFPGGLDSLFQIVGYRRRRQRLHRVDDFLVLEGNVPVGRVLDVDVIIRHLDHLIDEARSVVGGPHRALELGVGGRRRGRGSRRGRTGRGRGNGRGPRVVERRDSVLEGGAAHRRPGIQVIVRIDHHPEHELGVDEPRGESLLRLRRARGLDRADKLIEDREDQGTRLGRCGHGSRLLRKGNATRRSRIGADACGKALWVRDTVFVGLIVSAKCRHLSAISQLKCQRSVRYERLSEVVFRLGLMDTEVADAVKSRLSEAPEKPTPRRNFRRSEESMRVAPNAFQAARCRRSRDSSTLG